MPQAEGHAFGKYQLLDRIAAGGMAEIYRAKFTGAAGVTKAVVVKKILPHYAGNRNFVSMFINEAKIAVGLSHGNIAQVFDFGEIDGEYFLAMELVDGQPLSRVMRRAKDMGMPVIPIPFAAYIAMEMCKGLHYAHTRLDEQGRPLNIIHRDVSPQNIIISYEGQLKIVDFGIAKARNAVKIDTEVGAVKGKYVYFAPEQARGKEVDSRTDVFAAGVCLYEMICGRLPFEGKMMEVLGKIVRNDFPRPRSINPEIPPDLERILLTAMAGERSDRYPTAQAFQEALSGHLHASDPTFSAHQLAHLMSYLYEPELVAEGRPVQLPKDFLEQAHHWRRKLAMSDEELVLQKRTTPMRPKSQPRPFEAPEIRALEAEHAAGSAFDGPGDSAAMDMPSLVSRLPTRWIYAGAPVVATLIAALVVLAVGHFGSFSVHLTSTPSGAWVEVDGQRAPGVTPMMISNLAADRSHAIRLTALGMKPWSKTIQPAHGNTVSVEARLDPDLQQAPAPELPKAPEPAPRPAIPPPAPAPTAIHDLSFPLLGPVKLSPREHTCVIPKTPAARTALDPTKSYRVWLESKVLGQVFYFVEGPADLAANERFGLLTGHSRIVRHATALYAFVVAEAPRDNPSTAKVHLQERGEHGSQVLGLTVRENGFEPDPSERLRVSGLDPSRHYALVLREGTPPARLREGRASGLSRILAVLGGGAPSVLEVGSPLDVVGADHVELFFADDRKQEAEGVLELEIAPKS